MSIFIGNSEIKNAYIGTTPVKEIYVGTTKVRPSGWKPGANTVLYYPFQNDQIDHVGNSSISVAGTQESLGYTFNLGDSDGGLSNPPTTCTFISVWVKYNSDNGEYVQSPCTYIGNVLYNFNHSGTPWRYKFQICTRYDRYETSSAQTTTSGIWYHLAMGWDGSKVVAYINGVNVWKATKSAYNTGIMIVGRYINETLSEFIGESVCWTAQEVADYYNSTKGNYGL